MEFLPAAQSAAPGLRATHSMATQTKFSGISSGETIPSWVSLCSKKINNTNTDI